MSSVNTSLPSTQILESARKHKHAPSTAEAKLAEDCAKMLAVLETSSSIAQDLQQQFDPDNPAASNALNQLASTLQEAHQTLAQTMNLSPDDQGNIATLLSALMLELAKFLGQMRDLMRTYRQAQVANLFDAMKQTLNEKRDAIDAIASSQRSNAISEIVGGTVGVGFGAAGLKFDGVGALAQTSSISQGIGGTVAASQNSAGQQDQALADFMQSMTDSYSKVVQDAADRGTQFSGMMKDLLSNLVQLHYSLTSAVKLQ